METKYELSISRREPPKEGKDYGSAYEVMSLVLTEEEYDEVNVAIMNALVSLRT